MRALVQRVSQASVSVDGSEIGSIGQGLLIFLGVAAEDTKDDLNYIVRKTSALRIFPDAVGKMNLSVLDVQGEILLVSQFTLCAETRKGNRPSFQSAADPKIAKQMYKLAISAYSQIGISVATGEFGADMQVALINDGPVTIYLDSKHVE